MKRSPSDKSKTDSKRVKLEREPVEATPRKGATQRERLDLFVEQAGRCAECAAKMMLGEMQLDHRIPLELGGKDEPSNWQLLCIPCHTAKTRGDRKDIAKVRRQRLKDRGEFPQSKFKLNGRGFAPGRNKVFELSKTE